jgi:hypothetical protein
MSKLNRCRQSVRKVFQFCSHSKVLILSSLVAFVSKVSKISQIMSFGNFREKRESNLNRGMILKGYDKEILLIFLTTRRTVNG